MTTINRLYHDLISIVPEHMAAINVCLVKGWLRPATLLEPDWSRNRPVNFSAIEPVVQAHGLSSYRLDKDHLLVYQPDVEEMVDRVRADREDHKTLGELLGYRCPGDLFIESSSRYQINFIVSNPTSGNDNPFIGYICISLTQDLLDDLLTEGREIGRFLRTHSIAPRVKLRIWHRDANDAEVDDFNQWL